MQNVSAFPVPVVLLVCLMFGVFVLVFLWVCGGLFMCFQVVLEWCSVFLCVFFVHWLSKSYLSGFLSFWFHLVSGFEVFSPILRICFGFSYFCLSGVALKWQFSYVVFTNFLIVVAQHCCFDIC